MFRQIFCVLLLIAAPAWAAQDPPVLTAEAMWGLARVGGASLSPDGAKAVVPVTRYDVAGNAGLTTLYVLSVHGGPVRALTSGRTMDGDPRWSRDGKWIAFTSIRGDDKDPQIYVIAPDGGEARRLTDAPGGVRAMRWFPDSSHIAFVARIWADLKSFDEQARRAKARAESKMTAKVWDHAPVSQWDHFTDDRQSHLFSVDIEGGGLRPITVGTGQCVILPEPDNGIVNFDIAPDGEEIAFISNVDRTGTHHKNDVFVIAANGTGLRDLSLTSGADNAVPRYSPDGRSIAFGQQRVRGFWGDRFRLMLYDRAAQTTRGLTETFQRSIGEFLWLPDSTGLIGIAGDAGVQRVYRLFLDGGVPKALTGTEDFSGLDVAGTTLIGVRQSLAEPPALARIDLSGGPSAKITDFNEAALSKISLGKIESVTYKGAHNADIQMWIVHPPGFDPRRKYPLIMLLHGGPHIAFTDEWNWRWNAQVFASWGYVVAWPNFHGSSGFGDGFVDSVNPDYATLPYQDIIKAADWFRIQPWIDSARMVAGGGSFGGYLVTLLLGREHPFKALFAHAPVYDEFAQVGADYGADQDRFYEYWEEPAAFAARSPHMGAANFKTPTLISHGRLDRRVPFNNSIELFNTLQKKGVASRLIYFPDENHWILKPQDSLFWYQNVRDWLAAYAPPNH